MIYAIQAGENGPVKIGWSDAPKKRVRELQTGNPQKLRLLACCEIGDDAEYFIHIYLKNEKMVGEWFSPTSKTLKVVGLIALQSIDESNHWVYNYVCASEDEEAMVLTRKYSRQRAGL